MGSDSHERRAAAMAGPIVPLLPYQREDVESEARFRWNCWARQTGKSFTKSLRRLLRGLKRRRNQIFLSAGERQSRELMTKARQHCQALQIAASFSGDSFFQDTSIKQLEISLPNGVRLIGLPANPYTARGFTGDVLLDEFAMHRDDRDIWASIFPTILRGGGEMDVASTPKGLDNLFHALRENERFSHSTVTLYEAVSAGLDVDVDEIRASMHDEELFRQEFLCEFLDEATAFLTYEQIRRCEDSSLEKVGKTSALVGLPGDLYCGVDLGRRRDLTVIWVIERSGGAGGDEAVSRSGAPGRAGVVRTADPTGAQEPVWTTRAVIELRNEPFRRQYEVLGDVLKLRRVRRCCIDGTGLGMALAEAAEQDYGSDRVEVVQFTSAVKDELAVRMRRAVEEAALRIPADDEIRNDFHSVRRDVTATGGPRYDAPGGGSGHADRFWAAALALRAAGRAAGRVEYTSVGRLAFARRGAW